VKAFVVGDIHGHWDSLFQAARTAYVSECEVVFQVGDLGFAWPGGGLPATTPAVPVYFCDGNHENHRVLAEMPRRENGVARAYPGIYHVARGTILEFGGHKVLFAGGAFSIDRRYREEGVTWFEDETISQADADRMLSHPRNAVDMVVSHDCPFGVNLAEFNYPGAASTRDRLEQVWQRYKPKTWFFGHYHRFYHRDAPASGTTFFCLPCPHDDRAVGIVFDLSANEVDDVVPIWPDDFV